MSKALRSRAGGAQGKKNAVLGGGKRTSESISLRETDCKLAKVNPLF